MTSYYSLYFDGASKCNPGLSGCGCVIYNQLGEEMYNDNKFIGSMETNNVAEYCGLILGLQLAIQHNITHLHVYGDSNLIINQMNGIWKIKSTNLRRYYEEAISLAKLYEHISFVHVKRNMNQRADYLANLCIN